MFLYQIELIHESFFAEYDPKECEIQYWMWPELPEEFLTLWEAEAALCSMRFYQDLTGIGVVFKLRTTGGSDTYSFCEKLNKKFADIQFIIYYTATETDVSNNSSINPSMIEFKWV